MGAIRGQETDAWLRQGGTVIAATERAARAIGSAYHRARQGEGLRAWTAPAVLDWQAFARAEWDRRAADGRLILNLVQEETLWSDILGGDGASAATLPESRSRLAALAMEAHALLCRHAPHLLESRARTGWQQDAAAFSRWLENFEDVCRGKSVLSGSRVPLELAAHLAQDRSDRAALLLAGFDRILPAQQNLFTAWGVHTLAAGDAQQAEAEFYVAPDQDAELAACVAWCRKRLNDQQNARLLVLTQDAAGRRGAIERAFLASASGGSPVGFEFSLGVPLSSTAVARSALLLLRWLSHPLQEHELDWLFACGHAVRLPQETSALQRAMRWLRRHSLQRTEWSLPSFLQQRIASSLPSHWVERVRSAQRALQGASGARQSPVQWAELATQLLNQIGWPGATLGPSGGFQAARRLQQTIETCASLGFDGRRVSWGDFYAALKRATTETLFTAESENAPVLIAGPAESAGLTADGIWFLGASEESWPVRGSLHPLLPAHVQRSADMPHARPEANLGLARTITARLLVSAPEVCFSYARQAEGIELRPSRVIAESAGSPIALPAALRAGGRPAPIAWMQEDDSVVPLPAVTPENVRIRGGSAVLTSQSQCPFKAFASVRLDARSWNAAEAGLTPPQRGQLLHSVMHAIWAGPPHGIRTLSDLHQLADRRSFVQAHVEQVIAKEAPEAVRELMPPLYLKLEAERLSRLVTEWLEYEAVRAPFTVVDTELATESEIAGRRFDLRLDRIDQLNDGSLLVIDYKTGNVSQKSWDLPRPDDVQLPLYGGFALEPGQELGGLVFAKMRPGDLCFTGRVGDPENTLGSTLKNISSLKRNPLSAELLLDWRDAIEKLARDFVAGRADVDPKDAAKTCASCDLHAVCRIYEREMEMQEDSAEAIDE